MRGIKNRSNEGVSLKNPSTAILMHCSWSVFLTHPFNWSIFETRSSTWSHFLRKDRNKRIFSWLDIDRCSALKNLSHKTGSFKEDFSFVSRKKNAIKVCIFAYRSSHSYRERYSIHWFPGGSRKPAMWKDIRRRMCISIVYDLWYSWQINHRIIKSCWKYCIFEPFVHLSCYTTWYNLTKNEGKRFFPKRKMLLYICKHNIPNRSFLSPNYLTWSTRFFFHCLRIMTG